ncbi:MAG: hypothetical protein Q9174_005364 [Haloplaca sp. 1 TL-2023]
MESTHHSDWLAKAMTDPSHLWDWLPKAETETELTQDDDDFTIYWTRKPPCEHEPDPCPDWCPCAKTDKELHREFLELLLWNARTMESNPKTQARAAECTELHQGLQHAKGSTYHALHERAMKIILKREEVDPFPDIEELLASHPEQVKPKAEEKQQSGMRSTLKECVEKKGQVLDEKEDEEFARKFGG